MHKTSSPIYLSVVMSTYNDEKYIREAVDSILAQTYPYFEFIIVNDGSTDGTLELLQSYTDGRIRIIDKPNTGLANSLNVGIGSAKHDWIARMDADDVALPTRFEDQVRYIRDGVGVVGGQIVKINEIGNVIKRTRMPLSSFVVKMFLRCNISKVVHPTAIISKQALDTVGCYDDNFTAAQDKELWFRLSRKYKIVNTPEFVLKYRINSMSISVKRRKDQDFFSLLGFVKYVNHCSIVLEERDFLDLKQRVLDHPYMAKLEQFSQLLKSSSLPKRILIRIRALITSYKLAKTINIGR